MGCSDHEILKRALHRRSRLRKCGLVLAAGIRLLGLLALAFTAYGFLDYVLALQPRIRVIFDVALVAGFFGLLLSWLFVVHRMGNRDMAVHLDQATRDFRRSMLSACELSGELAKHTSPSENTLPDFLAESAVRDGVKKLQQLGYCHVFPWQPLRRAARTTGFQLLAALCIICLDFSATHVIAQRVLFPGRDIPPYSRYTFRVSPSYPSVLYGGDIELAVTIHGAPVRDQVMCLTRYEGRVTQTACYKEPGAHFVQRLERVTKPVAFCFSVGKARSRWQRIHVRYQPEVAAVRAIVSPPAYTALPARDLVVGSEPLQVLPGSRIELRVTSNRDLDRGELEVSPKSASGDALLVVGEPAAAGSMQFTWTAQSAATLKLRIYDVAGTPNKEPLVLEQTLTPDLPPEAVIDSPPRHSLAMAGSVLPIRGRVTDDHGLRYVGLVRGLVGYRDRFRTESGIGGQKQHEVAHELDLGSVGAVPGDVLEFYLEAGDLNPALDGVAASDIARVEIISEAEYTDMMRAQTTIDAFLARFREANRALKALRDSTAALQETLAAPERDDDAVAKQLKQLQKDHRAAQEVFLRLSLDFAIYDAEEQLQQQLAELSRSVDLHADWLHAIAPDDPTLPSQLERLAADLNPSATALEDDLRDAETIAAIARVMQQAQQFRKLLERQTELVRRLERYRSEALGTSQSLLRTMQHRQEEIRTQLTTFCQTVVDLAEALPYEMQKLADDATAFVEAIKEAEIPEYMVGAERAAENQNGRVAWQSASVALERMKALLPDGEGEGEGAQPCDGNSFAALCAGKQGGQCSGEGIGKTLAQMLAALCNKRGHGVGRGGMGLAGGGRAGGDEGDGYWVDGQSALDVPIFGPPRTDYGARPEGGEGHTGRNAGGRGIADDTTPQAHERLETRPRSKADSRSMPVEELPPKYRDAIKRYFSPQSPNGGAQP